MGLTHADLKLTNLIGKQSITIPALVNTGATFMCVTEAIAVQLGFDIRPLSKLAAVREVRGGSERRTGTYMAVFEDSSTEPTKKFPAAVEFGKRSIEEVSTHMVTLAD